MLSILMILYDNMSVLKCLFLGAKLKEAGAQQQFNRNIEDIELWLSEVEGQLLSEDFGKDLISVQNLQKRHGLLESDINAHQVRARPCLA